MSKIFSLFLSILFLAISFEKSLQNDAGEKHLPYPVRKIRDANDHLNSFDQQFLNYQLRHKRSYEKFGNDIMDNTLDEFEESQNSPTAIQNIESESVPPSWVMFLLAQKIKQQREREDQRRVKTPRLGRDIDDEIECQRSRPPFSPRLGKKSVPFKPRLGRSYGDDAKY